MGVAHYRNGEWDQAIKALEWSMALTQGGDGGEPDQADTIGILLGWQNCPGAIGENHSFRQVCTERYPAIRRPERGVDHHPALENRGLAARLPSFA